MKNDARHLLNKKKFINKFSQHAGGRRTGNRPLAGTKKGPIDARKILNSKRAGKISKNSSVPFISKTFASTSRVPKKQIQVSQDGNIWITSKSKNNLSGSITNSRRANINVSSSQNRFQWTPANVDTDDLEHISIQDVIDMDSLPSAATASTSRVLSHVIPPVRSLAEEVMGFQNTMVADQMASGVMTQSTQVIVTNLSASVSKQDIMELFGDLGLVKSVQMGDSGAAVIEFYSQNDAATAVTAYHNRLLDGQPMKCFLHTDTAPQRVSVAQRLGDRVLDVQPSTSRTVANPRIRYNPRNVHFTVKLT